jgi:glycosyltransferase EpsD
MVSVVMPGEESRAPSGVKVLYCAAAASHLRNFHMPYIQWLSNNGRQVTTLSDDGQKLPGTAGAICVPFVRKITSLSNIRAIFMVRRILAAQAFDLVITNTTLARLVVSAAAALLRKAKRPFLLNICHGYPFHDHEIKRKLFYLPPEKLIAGVTGLLVVMNHEDELIARKYKLGKQIAFVHGMGVDPAKFSFPSDSESLGGFTFFCAADFTKRKNQAALIRAFAAAADNMPGARLVFAGDGTTLEACKNLSRRLGVESRVAFLGRVANAAELMPQCDVAVSASLYEGLPFNIVEAMLCGLPVIASEVKGHRDLLAGTEGVLFKTEGELSDSMSKACRAGRRRLEYANAAAYLFARASQEWFQLLEGVVPEGRP